MKNYTLMLLFLLIALQGFGQKYANNAVSAAHPLAADAGALMYQQGGNAYDAAVATAFALAVVEPSMSGLGGRLQAIYQTSEGLTRGIDASTEVPSNYKSTKEKHSEGYETIGIPGVVRGLEMLHSGKGVLTWKTLLEPAINYAKNGYLILPGEAARQAAAKSSIEKYPGTKHYFLTSDVETFTAGSLVVQKDLARTLEVIARQGADGFYTGRIARTIARDMKKNNHILSYQDLRNYKALDLKVLEGTFRGHTIKSLYLPSYGAITLQILQIADHFAPPTNNTEWTNQLGHASEIGYQHRPFQQIPDSLASILSREKAAMWAQKGKKLALNELPENTTGESSATQGHTTHLTTADKWGNVVSLTQTLGPNLGSRVVTPGLGFLYAVTLGGYLGEYKPGDRAQSHISPTLVEKDGEIHLALGAAGGNKIVIAVAQVISRYVDQGFSLNESLALPRVYPNGNRWQIENHDGIFTRLGSGDQLWKTPEFTDQRAYFGRVHAVALDKKTNSWMASADPDWEGTIRLVE